METLKGVLSLLCVLAVIPVTVGAGDETTMLNALVKDEPQILVALTVKLYVPPAVGVPLMTPSEDRVSPGGNEPPITAHVNVFALVGSAPNVCDG